jgi:hypothetical protein
MTNNGCVFCIGVLGGRELHVVLCMSVCLVAQRMCMKLNAILGLHQNMDCTVAGFFFFFCMAALYKSINSSTTLAIIVYVKQWTVERGGGEIGGREREHSMFMYVPIIISSCSCTCNASLLHNNGGRGFI